MSDMTTDHPVGVADVAHWWRTGIVDIKPGEIRFRGYAVEELIGGVGFPDMIWLMLRGELPNPAQAALFAALLVAAVDHGPQAPSIAIARMAATCGIGINGAIASGVNALGDVHGGAGEQCMALLADIELRRSQGAPLDTAAGDGLADFVARHGKFVPGFGHRFHPVDPRATKLSRLMADAADDGLIEGRYLAAAIAAEAVLARGKVNGPPLNIDGMAAALLLELGFPPMLGRGVFILSRVVGICAHAAEQIERGERIKGPTPPSVGFLYIGPAPRSLDRGEV